MPGRTSPAEREGVRSPVEGHGWDTVIADWEQTRENAVLRAYSDQVNRTLIERWLPDLRNTRVLKTDVFDEAVGDGLYPALRDAGAAVFGIDLSQSAVTAATRRYPDFDAEVTDVRHLLLTDESFDVILSNSTLDHFESREEIAVALREFHRVLKPGGTLLITLDNPVNPLVALRNALPFCLLRRAGLVAYPLGATCGPRGLLRLLEDAGFTAERKGAVMHFPRILARALAALAGQRRTLGIIRSFEHLDRLPVRYLSGQFVAVRAVKNASPHTS